MWKPTLLLSLLSLYAVAGPTPISGNTMNQGNGNDAGSPWHVVTDNVAKVQSTAPDGGTPTCFATQPPALFTAADCAAALIADGGTLPVGAFLALTRGSLLSDGGWVDPGQPTAAGCEFVQPGANVSHARFWWTVRDARDQIVPRGALINFASGAFSPKQWFRDIGTLPGGDFASYQQTTGSAATVVGGVGAANSAVFVANAVGAQRGVDVAFGIVCTTPCVASGDGGTVMVRMSVWE